MQVMEQPSRSWFDRIVPVSDRYASLATPDAFSWSEAALVAPIGEWYLVVFRSTRRAGADEDRLTAHDDWAHAEAMAAPGFVHYVKGPLQPDGGCVSFCLWTGRAEARAAAGRPAHADAVSIVREMYAEYRLEFLRLRKTDPTSDFAFEPYDASSLPEADPGRAPSASLSPAPGLA
jgi:hypothetical protein